jgi:hypothetical protein
MNEIEEIWDYLDVDDDLEVAAELAAEEDALHVDESPEWRQILDDPVRGDDGPFVLVADDEDDGVIHRDDERELDVEELLERQHYAFAQATDDD